MKIFIWEEIDTCTSSYHSEGGVVVIAETEARARELANAVHGCAISECELPNATHELVDNCEEKVFIMPNAGCC